MSNLLLYIQYVQSQKYLGIDAHVHKQMSAGSEFTLQAGWKSYYLFKNRRNQSDTDG
jgi:hypothetical protein